MRFGRPRRQSGNLNQDTGLRGLDEYHRAWKTGSEIMKDPYGELKEREAKRKTREREREKQFKSFLFIPPLERLEMTSLTTVGSTNSLECDGAA